MKVFGEDPSTTVGTCDALVCITFLLSSRIAFCREGLAIEHRTTTDESPGPFQLNLCRRDEDGYYWITGRTDDVIKVSGHRMGTAEIESALVAHPKVSEAAVVGYPHDIKGQGIYCYVTLMAGEQGSDALKAELRDWVRKEIGPIASPDLIQFAPGLPKTRSGKIMRRGLLVLGGEALRASAQRTNADLVKLEPSQDRRGRFRQSWRHLDARRSFRRHRSRREPPESEISLRVAKLVAVFGRPNIGLTFLGTADIFPPWRLLYLMQIKVVAKAIP